MGADHACARDAEFRTRCWGDGARGALGNGMTAPLREATGVTAWNGVLRMTAGAGFTCGSVGFSEMRCAGRNDRGQVGDSSGMDRAAPVSVLQLTTARADFVQLTAGRAHVCTVLNDGTLWCWGENARGQIGDAFGEFLNAPERVWR